MFTVAQLNRSARLLATICTPLVLAGMFTPTAVSAQTTETVTIANNYGTAFSPLAPVPTGGGSNVTIYSGSYAPDAESELGLNYTATVDQDTGGFFFLHDNYCVGACDTISDTTIVFTVTNDSTQGGEQDIWFHSQITPGHLADIFGGGAAGATAGFDFTVSLASSFDGAITLYSASGEVNSDGIFLDTGGLTYNGLLEQTGQNFNVLDWQTTNLSINAGFLAAGQTMQIVYEATYWSSNASVCADVLLCPGAQVVFGDPRNNGGVILSSSLASFSALEEPAPADPLAVIGADYGAFFVPYAFTSSATSPFAVPATQADLVYGPLYRSRVDAIPEPESWALMILGFGAAGMAMRRQRPHLRMT